MPVDKITSKNLSYDQSLPPFLARLRGQQTSDTHNPDPILAARRRPGRIRSASEEAEDAPVVVDEEGNVVQLEAGQLGEDGTPSNGEVIATTSNPTEDSAATHEKEKKKVASIGATKKRKVGKVIGGDDEEQGRDGSKYVDDAIAKAVKETKKLANVPPSKEQPKPSVSKPAEKTGKKKAKKIKLSFGDDDG